MAKSKNILLAAAAGFIAGILFAPKSGKETREDINEKVEDAKQFTSDRIAQAKGMVKDGVDTVKHGAKTVGDQAGELAKSARSSAEVVSGEVGKLGDEAKSRSETASEETKRTARSVRHDIDKNS